ncbi:hypothetical protein ACLOJK_040255 [Asimina triloba]
MSSSGREQNSRDNSGFKGRLDVEEISECSQGSAPASSSQPDHEVDNSFPADLSEDYKVGAEDLPQKVQSSQLSLVPRECYAPLDEAAFSLLEMPYIVSLPMNNDKNDSLHGMERLNSSACSLGSQKLLSITSSDATQESETSEPYAADVGGNHARESVPVPGSNESNIPTSRGSALFSSESSDKLTESVLNTPNNGHGRKAHLETGIHGGSSLGTSTEASSIIDLDGCAGSLFCQSDIQCSEMARSLASCSLICQSDIQGSETPKHEASCSFIPGSSERTRTLTSCPQPYHPMRSSDMMEMSQCQNSYAAISPSLLYSGNSKLKSIGDDTVDGDISARTQNMELVAYSPEGFFYPYGSFNPPFNCVGSSVCMTVEGGQKLEPPKPVEMHPSTSTDANTSLMGIYGNTAMMEHQESEGLFYEPPRFPSLEIPFVSCDLISSGSEAYSPLGIRQLMMSSMNCPTPYSLWDSPSHDGSPDAVLKSAAKSFICTPSILKKRQRELLSPFQERKSDKKTGKDVNHGLFPTPLNIADHASTHAMETAIISPSHYLKRKPLVSPREKENLDSAPKDMNDKNLCPDIISLEKDLEKYNCHEKIQQGTNRSGVGMKTDANVTVQRAKDSDGVLSEHDTNEMHFFSPPEDQNPANRPLNNGSMSWRTKLCRKLEISSNPEDTNGHLESSSRNPCSSGLLSPNVSNGKNSHHFLPPPLQIPFERVGLTSNDDIENINIFTNTPGIRRSLESPSAWKSPWFMNSLLRGQRFDTEISFEDTKEIGCFFSPGERTYDAIGLMQQLNEQSAAALAEAREVLASGDMGATSNENGRHHPDQYLSESTNQIEDNGLEDLISLPTGASIECRVLDFSGCETPVKASESRKSDGAVTTVSFSSPSSYLLKGCRHHHQEQYLTHAILKLPQAMPNNYPLITAQLSLDYCSQWAIAMIAGSTIYTPFQPCQILDWYFNILTSICISSGWRCYSPELFTDHNQHIVKSLCGPSQRSCCLLSTFYRRLPAM